ncbi:hypothetical protein FRC06_010872, partial [Ceratobasidium sp. 370]
MYMQGGRRGHTTVSLPRPLTFRNHIVVECYKRTRYVPRKFQLYFAIAVDLSQDVLCVAGTGSGKSLAFISIYFFRPDVITWIVSPLNVIEDQMAADYAKYKLEAVAVNASTVTPELIERIKEGEFQVIIPSPEAYKDNNKLRQALLSPELAHKKHVTIVDEAHCIPVWGATGFRKEYERSGDMREGSDAIAACEARLPGYNPGKLASQLALWSPSHEKSHSDICDFFDSSVGIKDTPQAMIFVEDYTSAHTIADKLRTHFGLSGQEASDLIPVYHSLIDNPTKRRTQRRFKKGQARILITTEALTMGADFPNVQLVLNFLSPTLLEIWIQRAGRGARLVALLCIIMVTKHQVAKAIKMCDKEGIQYDPVLLAMKSEEGEKDQEGEDDANADVPEESTDRTRTTKRFMSPGMAEYIATGISGACLTNVIDRYSSNPAHTPCVEVGGCENCAKRRADDPRHKDRQDSRLQEQQQNSEENDLPQKKPKPTDSS